MDKHALIVAGGKGTRMNTNIPKQYLLLQGTPIIMHTIQRFHAYDPSINIILVLPKNDFALWNTLCNEHHFEIPHDLVAGGRSRFQSVKNGLNSIKNDGIVAIHDGVRPLVELKTIRESFEKAAISGNAVASMALKESIRRIDDSHSKAEDRSRFRSIQTPQTFRIEQIKQAYSSDEQLFFTDDASVAEYVGFDITLIEGSYSNIKITTMEDLMVAESLVKEQKKTDK